MTQEASTEKHLFLDTMMYMHFRPVDEVDWPQIADAKSVVIVVPRITAQELDKHKNSHSSRKVKDRIKRFLTKLEQTEPEKDSVLRANVRLRYQPLWPTIEFSELGLSKGSADDMLVAAVAAYQRDVGGDVLLISDDSTPRLTARHLGIVALSPPDSLRLSDELTETEKENMDLKRQIQKLSQALPKLQAQFKTKDGEANHVTFTLLKPLPLPEKEIEETLEQVRLEHPHYNVPEPNLPSPEPSGTETVSDWPERIHKQHVARMTQRASVPSDEYARANRDIDSYVREHAEYLKRCWEWKNARLRTLKLEIEVVNEGTTPAEDVDVQFYFPDGFKMWAGENTPPAPSEPKEPRPPQSTMEMAFGNIARGISLPPGFDVSRALGPEPTFSIRRTNSYLIEDRFDRIKHGSLVKMKLLFVEFDSYETAKSFYIDYELRPANLPEPTRGKLHVVVQKDEAGDG